MIYLYITCYIVLLVLLVIGFNYLKGYVVDEEEKRDNTTEKSNVKNNKMEEKGNKRVEISELRMRMSTYIDDVVDTRIESDELDLQTQKMIEEDFNYNYEKIIEAFIDKTNNDNDYAFCKRLKNVFNMQNNYELMTLDDDAFLDYLSTLLNEREYKFIKQYMDTMNLLDLNDVINFIDELLVLNDPHITIYVGDKNENYNHLSKLVNTKYCEEIYKGIKILYRGKMYDYSLSK